MFSFIATPKSFKACCGSLKIALKYPTMFPILLFK